MTDAPPRPIRFGDLGVRLLSGLVLAAVAFFDVWMGGAWAVGLVGVLLVLMLWELHAMVTGDRRAGAPACLALALGGAGAVIATAGFGLPAGFALLCAGGALAGLLARGGLGWLLAGSLYLGGAMCVLIVLRAREPDGFLAIVWLVLVVVAADVGAYFSGRFFGGPKLWPRVSPGKTWAGVWGGLALAGVAGLGVALGAGWSPLLLVALSLVLAAASILGDLLESAVKRRFAVKDSSRLIPGHGGVLDRLDGLVGAAWVFLALGMVGRGFGGA
jgi:phosphatidate cytidylyltransferase